MRRTPPRSQSNQAVPMLAYPHGRNDPRVRSAAVRGRISHGVPHRRSRSLPGPKSPIDNTACASALISQVASEHKDRLDYMLVRARRHIQGAVKVAAEWPLSARPDAGEPPFAGGWRGGGSPSRLYERTLSLASCSTASPQSRAVRGDGPTAGQAGVHEGEVVQHLRWVIDIDPDIGVRFAAMLPSVSPALRVPLVDRRCQVGRFAARELGFPVLTQARWKVSMVAATTRRLSAVS